MKNKRILVTGGSGFIPSHVVRRLVHNGNNVTVIVKYNSLIDNVRLVDIWDDINVIEADLRNIDSLNQISSLKPEIIIHMAAYNHVGDSFINVNEALLSNGVGTANLLNVYDDYELFVYTSTSEVYGYQESVPFVEGMNPAPISPYSIGKYSGELYARMLSTEKNKPIIILRPFNTFGPYQSPRAIIGELIIKCLRNEIIETTEGEQTREFNYVSNVVDAFMLAIEKRDQVIGKITNIGAGEELKINELVKIIHKLTESTSELKIGALENRPTEIWRMYTDAVIAKEVLGWEPKVKFVDGIKKTILWYQNYLNVFNNDSDLVKLSSY
tara:strand:- start:467 stop:1447 length:981 start_codon:yes stop_codon:yes gene_type:complete